MRVLVIGLLAAVHAATAEEIDLLQLQERWIAHPVLGAPAWNVWDRNPGNPIVRGAAPYEWPVNGTLFVDPVSSDWFLYVGQYPQGYAMLPHAPMRCVVMRSRDAGETWEDLGTVLPPSPPHVYAGETAPIAHAPDMQVIHADGKYHAVFDWVSEGTTWENVTDPGPECNNGVGYMWADKPEGPWHVTERPVFTTRDMPLLHGKYRRLYASSIVRRANDWLVLTDVDSGPHFGWGLVGMTAARPEGPYSVPKLLLSCEGDNYYPPLIEHFPAYLKDGTLFMPGTSVAKNRGVQALFAVELERALEPGAWRLASMETFLQPVPAAHEHAGIWGQAYSLAFTPEHIATVMFPSRDAAGMGTINLARHRAAHHGPARMWAAAYSARSLVIAPVAGELRRLSARLKIHGTVTLLWGQHAPLGPAAPRSDAEPAALSLTGYAGVRLSAGGTIALVHSELGQAAVVIDARTGVFDEEAHVELDANRGEIRINGKPTFQVPGGSTQGNVGLLAESHSFAEIAAFSLETASCDGCAARVAWLPAEALLGAAQGDDPMRWRRSTAPHFRFGHGYESQAPGVRAKWNAAGRRFTLWSPRGRGLGIAEVLVDGEKVAEVDLSSDTPRESAPVYESDLLHHAGHAVVVRPKQGRIVIDSLETHW